MHLHPVAALFCKKIAIYLFIVLVDEGKMVWLYYFIVGVWEAYCAPLRIKKRHLDGNVWWALQFTCPGVFALLVARTLLLSAPFVVVTGALVKPGLGTGAAVTQLALAAADDRLCGVVALRTLETVSPCALRIPPAVAVLTARLHVHHR